MLDAGHHQAAGLARALAPRTPNLLAFPLADGQPVHWIARIAQGLRACGRKPLLLDAYGGLVAFSLGSRPQHDLIELLRGERDFDEVALCTPDGVWVLRGERGIDAFAQSGEPPSRLLSAFANLSQGFDDVLLAMPAGEIASMAPPQLVVPVIGLDAGSTSLVACYGQVKQLATEFGFRRFACVIHGEPSVTQAAEQCGRLADTLSDFLGVDLRFGAWLAPDGANAEALAIAAEALLQAVGASDTNTKE